MTDKYDDYYDSESQHGSALAAWERARFEGQQRRRLGYVEEHPITLKEAIYSVVFWIVVLPVGFTHGFWWALAASVLVITAGMLWGVCDETQKDGELNRRLGSFGLCVLGACFAVIAWVFFGDTIINILDTVGAMIANILYGIAVAVRG